MTALDHGEKLVLTVPFTSDIRPEGNQVSIFCLFGRFRRGQTEGARIDRVIPLSAILSPSTDQG